MLKAMSLILICGAALPALSQSTSRYTVGTITGVQPHQGGATSSPSANSYDVSLKVGKSTYVVLYTPPYGLQTVRYATGRQFLVLVGEKTITLTTHWEPVQNCQSRAKLQPKRRVTHPMKRRVAARRSHHNSHHRQKVQR